MGKKLVIVESPAKAKTINKILGKDFQVESSMGHVRDLPVKSLGVDVEHGFEPHYVLIKGRRAAVDKLRKAASGSEAVYLAPDPDREGEAIAWHLQQILAKAAGDVAFHRVQYNEITPRAVRAAFDNPGTLDMCRVNAQQARRVLDRLVGYTVSPLLWRRVQRGLSAGRVQSVALRLVCEREDEIDRFVPEPYWVHGAVVRKLIVPLDPFEIKLVRIDGEKADIRSEEQSQGILGELEGRSMRVSKVATRRVNRRPPPPFITSTLQQAASTRCGFSPKRTMMLAQRLYEGLDLGGGPVGLITYMRTDSLHIAQDAVAACRGHVEQTLGREYLPDQPNVYKSRAGAQEAHEAIRPTDVTRTPESLKGKLEAPMLKLYSVVWKRFVASQMAQAQIDQRSVTIEAVPPADDATRYEFQVGSSVVHFPGFMRVWGEDKKPTSDEEEKSQAVPGLAEGEPLERIQWLADRKETKPPPRFTETSLVGALESNGVGRPSTYAQIISTLYDRNYARQERRTLFPSDLGRRVSQLLASNLGELFDVGFTAKMEQQLDEVESGNIEWNSMLAEFYARLDEWMKKTKGPPADAAQVRRTLDVLQVVQEWAPPVKRGRRTFSDERFVKSIDEQLQKGEKDVSMRQFDALLRIACKYREQVPNLPEFLVELGRDGLLEQVAREAPREETVRKLKLLEDLELEESARKFVDSLDQRVSGGRGLTEAQLGVLNSILLANGEMIPEFERLKEELEIRAPERPPDEVSEELLAAMQHVREWNPPTQRGKRVFDDKSFFESLSKQFSGKGGLSERQQGALKRLVTRYRAQVPDYDALAEKYKLKKGGRPAAAAE